MVSGDDDDEDDDDGEDDDNDDDDDYYCDDVYNAWYQHRRENRIKNDPRVVVQHPTDAPIRPHHRQVNIKLLVTIRIYWDKNIFIGQTLF